MKIAKGLGLFFIVFLVIAMPVFAAISKNLLINGSFEGGVGKFGIPKGWGTEPYNQKVLGGAKVGKKCLQISNSGFAYSLGAQEFPLDGTKHRWVSVSARVKGKAIVKGKEDWAKANLQILFFDAEGKQLEGWPELGPWTGTFGWTKYAKMFAVPPKTAKGKVVLGLINASGTVWFDDIQVLTRYPNQGRDPFDLISNGDFEIWEDWAYGGAEGGGVIDAGYNSVRALRVSNVKPMWSMASQVAELDGRIIKRVNVSGYARTENVVAGANDWEKARVNLEFKDQSGSRVGGWPLAYSTDGTSPWKRFETNFAVPPEARRVEIYAGLLNCTGGVYFDNLQMVGYRANGAKYKTGQAEKVDLKNYYAFKPAADDFTPTALDVSFLLDAPAGKYGFMQVKDGHFYFPGGRRARFWGLNVSGPAAFPTHENADRFAVRLAKYGCNLIRLHHLDAYWAETNIFDPAYDDTGHFSAENLDRLDYFVAKLKEKGIYIYLDLLVHRKFKKGDNVADYQNVVPGAKVEGFYNARIIELQKQYAKAILTHRNPYTGMAYKDDPAIVSVKIINEATLHYLGTLSDVSPVYLAELDRLWNAWLMKKYSSRQKLEKAWWNEAAGGSYLKSSEDPQAGTVKRGEMVLAKYTDQYRKFDYPREADTSAFYYEIETNYYKDMQKYLAGLGVKVPLSGSNHWENILSDVAANRQLDYIDRHRYWDHPRLAYGTKVIFDDLPMVQYPDASLPVYFAAYKIAGKPYSISEWNCCWPNEYISEGPMIMAAYAALQDWDAVLQFDITSPDWVGKLENNFDVAAWPAVLNQWPAAALLFHRRDVGAAKHLISETIPADQVFGVPDEDRRVGASGQEYLPLVSRVERKLDLKSGAYAITGADAARDFYDNEAKQISSDTAELFWNYAEGVVMINVARTQAVVGFVKGKKFQLANVLFEPRSEFAALTLSSIDGAGIADSKHLLLTAAGKMRNTGQFYSEAKTQLKELGKGPILLEGIGSKVTLYFDKPGAQIEVWKLDSSGKRLSQINAPRVGQGFVFEIKPQDRAINYEIVR